MYSRAFTADPRHDRVKGDLYKPADRISNVHAPEAFEDLAYRRAWSEAELSH